MITKFWDTLFDAKERICIADNVYESVTGPYNSSSWNASSQFFCINPVTNGRLDKWVTSFRNILIEFDKLSLDKQRVFAQTIPFSTVTFSGGKSYHYIISLDEPCSDIKEYKRLVKRIYNKLPDCDKSTGNPSRLSRTPGAFRDNGVEQTLMLVKQRVSRALLEDWLGPDLKTEESVKVILPIKANGKRLLPSRTLAFIEFGANEGGRNRALFINACELFRANYNKEEIYEIALKVLDLPVHEIRQCIESARKAVANE